mmetsp:Transcript_3150/g.12645  ORF Transcript_3150/g.12645 Transcript_3150/m.12645 type:complete len:117 (+) Transcript_3150:480-830(+)
MGTGPDGMTVKAKIESTSSMVGMLSSNRLRASATQIRLSTRARSLVGFACTKRTKEGERSREKEGAIREAEQSCFDKRAQRHLTGRGRSLRRRQRDSGRSESASRPFRHREANAEG